MFLVVKHVVVVDEIFAWVACWRGVIFGETLLAKSSQITTARNRRSSYWLGRLRQRPRVERGHEPRAGPPGRGQQECIAGPDRQDLDPRAVEHLQEGMERLLGPALLSHGALLHLTVQVT